MRYVRQFMIIIILCFLGELLRFLIPMPIPAGIYGMALLFIALETKLLKVSHIRETAQFLIDIMPVMFVPAGVGLISTWDALKPIWLQVVIISLVSTAVVMAASGLVTQKIMRKEGGRHE